MRSSTPRLRKLIGRLLLMAFPLLMAFGVAELALRLKGETESGTEESAPSESSWLTVVPSAELGWIFPPDTTGVFNSYGIRTPVATNSWGLRGPQVSTDTLTRRVLVLGDSYTFGWGVDDASGFVRLLETEFRTEFPETPIEFVNGGLPGYSIYQQIRMLDYVTDRAKIDAVVATISLANDPIDERRIRRFAPDHLEDFSYDLRDPDSRTSRLISSSRLLTLMDQRTTDLQFTLLNTSGECRDLAGESLKDLATACREAGLPLIWVIVPRAQEIRPGVFFKRALNGATEKMRGHFIDLATDLDIPTVDLKPALESFQAQGDVFIPRDTHWNEKGHQAVAQTIMPTLLEKWKTVN